MYDAIEVYIWCSVCHRDTAVVAVQSRVVRNVGLQIMVLLNTIF